MSDRFTLPVVGRALPVRFPPIAREVLDNGLRVWSIAQTVTPVVTVALVVARGTAEDPADRPGLVGLTADLLDEGADGRDAIQLAEVMSRLGTQLDTGVGPDVITLGFTCLSRVFPPALDLLAGVVQRPHLSDVDFSRIRELRMNRLRQLRQSAGAVADRVFLGAVFGAHGYNHGALGTTAALEAMTLDDARAWQAEALRPDDATLIVTGNISHESAVAAARHALGGWSSTARRRSTVPAERIPDAAPALLFVDRPGAAQSELRIGHVAPPRTTEAYHALVTLNSAMGGQFSSRINRHLRERKGVTYGARTNVDFRRTAGTFSCETSVQGDATAGAVTDIHSEYAAVRGNRPVDAAELDRAARSLTRGYVRHFETATQLAHAALQLATYSLPDETFDQFVPVVQALTERDLLVAAERFVLPDASVVVVVGDAAVCRRSLDDLGSAVVDVTPEF